MQQIFNDFPLFDSRFCIARFSIPSPPSPPSSPFRAGLHCADWKALHRPKSAILPQQNCDTSNKYTICKRNSTRNKYDIWHFFQWNNATTTKIKTVCSDFVLLCAQPKLKWKQISFFCFCSLSSSRCLFRLLLLLCRFSLLSLSLSPIRCCRNNASDLNVIATHSNSYLRRLKKPSKTWNRIAVGRAKRLAATKMINRKYWCSSKRWAIELIITRVEKKKCNMLCNAPKVIVLVLLNFCWIFSSSSSFSLHCI